jgi:hypothetical protein
LLDSGYMADSLTRECLQELSSEELRELLRRCEEAIAAGDAEVKTFEAFIRYQQELTRRAWS